MAASLPDREERQIGPPGEGSSTSSAPSEVAPLADVVAGRGACAEHDKSNGGAFQEKDLRIGSGSTSGSDADDTVKEDGGIADGTQRRTRWYTKLNPLRLRRPPPIPEERSVSREYKAGFLSLVTFQWMSPLMMVSFIIENSHNNFYSNISLLTG